MSKIHLVQLMQGSQAALAVCREALHSHQMTEGDIPKVVVGSSSGDSQTESSDILSSTPSIASMADYSALLWCRTAEIFISCKQFSDAEESIKEAQQIAPNTTNVLLLVCACVRVCVCACVRACVCV